MVKVAISRSFQSRDDFDAYIRATYGDDATKNKDIFVELTKEEMQTLQLSEDTTVHGVRIRKVSTPRKPKAK